MRTDRTIFFLLAKSDINGITTHCADLAKELRLKGYNIIFIYGNSRHDQVSKFFIRDKFQVYAISFSKEWNLRSAIFNFSACLKFIRLLLRYKPRIVHCHFRSTVPFALLGRLLLNTKNLLTIHTHNMPENTLVKLLLSKMHNYIAISSEIERSLLERKINGRKIHKIFNGADDSSFKYCSKNDKAALRLQYGFDTDKLTILTTARLVKLKSIDTLIKALALLNTKELERIQCIIVGDGSQMNSLNDLTHSLGIQHSVTFTGFCKPHNYYALSDIFVLPSRREGFSVAVVEAMLSGLAILKTPTSGTNDQVVDGGNGFIFHFSDCKALAEKIRFLLYNPSILKTMQENSYKIAVSEFTIKKMGEAVAAVYTELLNPITSSELPVSIN